MVREAGDRQLVDLLEPLEQHVRAAERQGEEEREEPSGGRAEGQGAEPLEPAEVDFAPAVDAVEGLRQGSVGLEESIAMEELGRRGQVAQLQVAPRGGVAEVAEVREPTGDNRVEQLFDELAVGDALGQVGRPDPGRFESGGDSLPEPLAEVVLGPPHGRAEQPIEAGALIARQAGPAQPTRRGPEMLRHVHFAEVRQRVFERRRPRENSQPIGSSRKTSRSWSRQTFCRSCKSRLSGDQNPAAAFSRSGASASDPKAGFPLLDEEGLAKPDGELLERGPGRSPLAEPGLRTRPTGRPRPEDRRPDVVAALGGPTGPVRHPGGTDAIPASYPHSRFAGIGSGETFKPAVGDDRGARVRRAGGPGRGEDRAAVDVTGQHRLDGGGRLDRREDGRPQCRLEGRQLEEPRRERGIGRRVRFRRQQQAVVPQDRAGFFELGPADRADTCFEPGRVDGSGLERARQSALDPRGRAAATLPSG